MKKSISDILLSVLFGAFFSMLWSISAFADIRIIESKIYTDPMLPAVNQEMKIYVNVQNRSTTDAEGIIKVYNETTQMPVDIDRPFSIVGKKEADIFFTYTPTKAGINTFAIKLILWEGEDINPENNKITTDLVIDGDNDGDGISDAPDPDDDNDGVMDIHDMFPFDPTEQHDNDRDSIGDNKDDDDDNDGILDIYDAFPFDAREEDDIDGDGIGNNEDNDDDGDGIQDDAESILKTDPLKFDTDGDGVNDGIDQYPIDPKRQIDSDVDGIDDSNDNDDDNDGHLDSDDAFPTDPKEWKDSDGDGIGDFADPDDDGDGLFDDEEFKLKTNPINPDTDGDGVNDREDKLPLDPLENKDSDNDGIGDNADTNDYNKGPILIINNIPETKIERGETLTLDAQTSYDPEGGGLEYLWEVYTPDGIKEYETHTPILKMKYTGIGKKMIKLSLYDQADEERTKEIEVIFIPSKLDFLFIFLTIFTIGGIFFLRRIISSLQYTGKWDAFLKKIRKLKSR